MAEPLDIGHGVTISFYEYRDMRAGLVEEHPSDKSPTGRCSGSVAFRGLAPDAHPSWIVEQMDPLTLSPSLLCTTCGHHGFIRNGRWEPA